MTRPSSVAAVPSKTPRTVRDQQLAAQAETPGVAFSCVLGFSLFTAWITAGSGGLMGHALRHAVTWCGMVAIVLAAMQLREWRFPHRILVIAVLIIGVVGVGLGTPLTGVFCVAGLVTALQFDRRFTSLRPLALGILFFALYRFAAVSIPTVWLIADRVGSWLGALAGFCAGEPLNVGATFGGIDLLILSFAFVSCSMWGTHDGRLPSLITCAVSIFAGLIAYLTVVAKTPVFLALAEGSAWKDLAAQLIPWNLPILGVLLLTSVLVMLSRWFGSPGVPQFHAPLWNLLTPLLALLLPVVSTFSPTSLSLQDRKIVFYEKGFLNWMRPEHGEGYGRLSIGMYGMAKQFLEMHGAQTLVSKALFEDDLKDANALVLIYPDKPWEAGQLERIDRFVKNGGTLLVMGEHTIHGPDKDEMHDRKPYWPGEAHSRFNDVLVDSDVRVNFDSATFAVGGWLQSYEAIAHPITAGVGDTKNEFGSVIGASLNVRWPAKPILIGRYGWNDPGDEGSSAAMMGNHKYDAGERLGDVILAAEDNVGKGRVVVFGDTSAITNGINVGCHDFNARLYSYVTNSSLGPQALWRQFIGAAMAIALGVGWFKSSSTPVHLLSIAAFVGSLSFAASLTHANATLLPDGRITQPNKLAYIDQSHLESSSQESWRDDGTMGVGMCLMRDGYVALTMPEFTKERLERAGILISVAPNRPFNAKDRAILREWIENGGIFILTVGWPERAGSMSLLDDLGFGFGKDKHHPATDKDPPEPQGFFKSPYIEADGYRAHVRFHAAWPIYAVSDDAKPIAYGADNSSIILKRAIGKGTVVVVGDTNFATNQNLEREGGEPFDGMRENNDFWRWLFADLTGGKPWIPKAPATQPEGGAQ